MYLVMTSQSILHYGTGALKQPVRVNVCDVTCRSLDIGIIMEETFNKHMRGHPGCLKIRQHKGQLRTKRTDKTCTPETPYMSAKRNFVPLQCDRTLSFLRYASEKCDSVKRSADLRERLDGLVQDNSYSSALAMELLQYCTKPRNYFFHRFRWV